MLLDNKSNELVMQEHSRYINVILPLKLGWEPFYVAESWQSVQVGDRVTVPFAGRRYIGVVSAVDSVLPESVPPSNVKPVRCVNTDLPRVLESEIKFFREVADYYMCTVGEVFKMAYPSVRDVTPSARASARVSAKAAAALSARELEGMTPASADESVTAVLETLNTKPLLIDGNLDVLTLVRRFYLAETSEIRNVLWLVPDLKFSKTLEEAADAVLGTDLVVWRSDLTPARRRKALEKIRSGEPYIVLGTKTAVLLPHTNLGLVLVQDEHEHSYKHGGGSPRFNGRDAAVLLASHCGARVVLQSASPSLESLYNSASGKYTSVKCDSGYTSVDFQIVDTRAELRKNGMVGELSRKLIHAVEQASEFPEKQASEVSGRQASESPVVAIYKPQRAMFPKMEELASQVEAAFGSKAFLTDDLVGNPIPSGVQVLGILGIDSLLGRADFRADERAYHAVNLAIEQCMDSSATGDDESSADETLSQVVIQTRESDHPLFKALAAHDITPLLEERRLFEMPPYSRLVDIIVRDTFPERASRMMLKLNRHICGLGFCKTMLSADRIRVILPRNKYLLSRKVTLQSVVENFEKEEKYASHLSFDVDPL